MGFNIIRYAVICCWRAILIFLNVKWETFCKVLKSTQVKVSCVFRLRVWDMAYVHLWAERCIASCKAERKWVHRRLPDWLLNMSWMIILFFSHKVRDLCSGASFLPFALMDSIARDEEAGLPGNARAQRPRSSVPSFLFISFMLFMLTSHNGDEFLARHQYQDAVLSLTYQLSNYTSWLNGNASNFSVVSVTTYVIWNQSNAYH